MEVILQRHSTGENKTVTFDLHILNDLVIIIQTKINFHVNIQR